MSEPPSRPMARTDDPGARPYSPGRLRGRALHQPLTGHTSAVLWGAWGHIGDEPVLATSGDDQTVRLWNPATGQPRSDLLTGHIGTVVWGAWGHIGDKPVLATGGYDGTVRLWNPATGQPHSDPLTGHTGTVWWGAWGQTGEPPVLATGGSYDRTVRLWEVVEDRPVPRLPSYQSDVSAAASFPEPTREPMADSELFGVRLPAARVIERVDPLTLEPDELKLLNLLGPPLLVATPRSTKRLANSYGLLTALRRDHRAGDLREHRATIKDATGDEREVAYYPYRASMVLLAALVAHPALGPDLFRSLHNSAATNPKQTWLDFLHQPHTQPGNGKSGPTRQWQALFDGLLHVTQTAAPGTRPAAPRAAGRLGRLARAGRPAVLPHRPHRHHSGRTTR